MRSNLKILTQLSKNLKSKVRETPVSQIPKHMRRFPNMKYSKTDIIHYEKRIKNDVDFEKLKGPTNLPVYKYRISAKLEPVRPPLHDFMNFRYMSGNEILLNMKNAEHFRHGELCNSLYELARRIELPANKDLKDVEWEKHEYVKRALNQVIRNLCNFNLKNVIITSVAFDKLNIKNPSYWLKIESICDRLLHKLKCRHILTLLKILNNSDMRGTREFSHKLITILPIHTPSIRFREMIDILEVCVDNNLQAERLINYFLLPKIEKTVHKFSFENYILLLKVLAKMKYQEDPIFWSDFVFPCIFNYEMTYQEAKTLWEAYLNVKINCPSLEVAKYFILIENILSKFEILIKNNQDVSLIKLAIDKDYSLIPRKEASTGSNIKIKRLQQRISEKEGKENVLRELGINVEKGAQGAGSVEGSLNKILEIKDWKKAKYDFNVLEMKRLKAGELAGAVEAEEITPEAVKEEGGVKEVKSAAPGTEAAKDLKEEGKVNEENKSEKDNTNDNDTENVKGQ